MFPSWSLMPSACVLARRSDPARSTILSLECHCFGSEPSSCLCVRVMDNVKIQCDRLD